MLFGLLSKLHGGLSGVRSGVTFPTPPCRLLSLSPLLSRETDTTALSRGKGGRINLPCLALPALVLNKIQQQIKVLSQIYCMKIHSSHYR